MAERSRTTAIGQQSSQAVSPPGTEPLPLHGPSLSKAGFCPIIGSEYCRIRTDLTAESTFCPTIYLIHSCMGFRHEEAAATGSVFVEEDGHLRTHTAAAGQL
jgi:hypothetical protein